MEYGAMGNEHEAIENIMRVKTIKIEHNNKKRI